MTECGENKQQYWGWRDVKQKLNKKLMLANIQGELPFVKEFGLPDQKLPKGSAVPLNNFYIVKNNAIC